MLQYAVDTKLDVCLSNIYEAVTKPPLLLNPYPRLLHIMRAHAAKLDLFQVMTPHAPMVAKRGDLAPEMLNASNASMCEHQPPPPLTGPVWLCLRLLCACRRTWAMCVSSCATSWCCWTPPALCMQHSPLRPTAGAASEQGARQGCVVERLRGWRTMTARQCLAATQQSRCATVGGWHGHMQGCVYWRAQLKFSQAATRSCRPAPPTAAVSFLSCSNSQRL